MRRTSLTTEQAAKLAAIIHGRRIELGLSLRGVAAQAGFPTQTVATIEAGTNLSPLPETIKGIARVLDLTVSDLYLVADWLPINELPTLKPYLRAKYHDLNENDMAELERYAERLAKRHGGIGPIDREDEKL